MTDQFDWGSIGADNDYVKLHKRNIESEIFKRGIYELFFPVEEGDIVVDFGASVGPFGYSILPKKPAMLYCFEPSPAEFPTLMKNLPSENVLFINKGISDTDGFEVLHAAYGETANLSHPVPTMTFRTFLLKHNIQKIDFLKTDCEGGEYSIFTIEHFSWIHANVKKIVGEWHLETPEMIKKFVKFKDLYLRSFDDVKVHSVNGYDITDKLHDPWFITYFKQVIIYINNTKK